MTNVLLIDLSSIAHPLFHVSASDPDPNATSTKTVERVRALASGQPHVGVCVEGGRSFRKDLDPSYKANRPESDATLQHQIALAIDILRADGFPILQAKGFEADDCIATATALLLSTNREGQDVGIVTVASADKDLVQLVSPQFKAKAADGSTLPVTPACVVKSLKDGSIVDATVVQEKFGVRPDQMLDFLTLCGDATDNIKGCTGVGKTRAAGLLAKYGTIDQIFNVLDNAKDEFTPALSAALNEFRPRVERVRDLIRLRTDAPIDVADVLKERVPLDVATFGGDEDEDMEGPGDGGAVGADADARADGHREGGGQGNSSADCPTSHDGREESNPSGSSGLRGTQPTAIAHRVTEVAEPTPVEWERQLEPRNMAQMKALATDLFASRLFSAYGHPAGVLSTILAGRELGLPAMAALRGFHIIDGKPTMAADLIRAQALRSGVLEYFRCTERTNERATFVAKRKGDPEMSLTFTIEDAKRAWSKGQAAWDASGYGRNPADMLVARAGSKLARLVAPDVVSGLYAPEELE